MSRTLCNPGIFRPLQYLELEEYSEFCQASGIFRTLVYLEPGEYSEPCQASVMHHFLNELWHIQNPHIFWNHGISRTLSSTYDEKLYSEPFVTIAYLDFWYIQNLSIFRTQDIQNTVNVVYTEPCTTLAYLEPWHIQNPRHIQNTVKHLSWNILLKILCDFEIKAYLEPCKISNMGHFIKNPV